jgi:nuclear pore complex protein Nup107
MKRVPLSEVMKDLVEEGDDSELENLDFWTEQVEQRGLDVAPEKLMAEARTFRELEKLVKTLDTLETIASLVEISAE